MPIGAIWQTLLETPLINFMVVLSALAGGSYGAAILLFTVISRALTFPLTLRTMQSMKALQAIQPQMQEISKKYSDPRRRSEETMKLYKEAGVNPLGCLGPQLIQFPIFIALYQVIRITLGSTPETVLDLSKRLYDVPYIQNAIPLSQRFLTWFPGGGMDLSANGGIPLTLVVFCGMWLQQRISSGQNAATMSNDQQKQMNSMMQWMMPIMFSYFVLVTPAGLGIYWAASTTIGVILQWVFVGPGDFTWGSLVPNVVRERLGMRPATRAGDRRGARRPSTTVQAVTPTAGSTESRAQDDDASSGDQRSNRRGSDRPGTESTGPAPRAGRRRRHH